MTVNCEHGDDANGLYVQRHNPATYCDDLNGVWPAVHRRRWPAPAATWG